MKLALLEWDQFKQALCFLQQPFKEGGLVGVRGRPSEDHKGKVLTLRQRIMTDFHILLLPILLLKTFMTYTTGRNFTVGLLIPYTTPDTSSADLFGIRYAPASLLALENINNSTHLLPGHHLSLVWNDTKCDRNLALKALIYQIYEKRVDAVIGPACYCDVGARLANVENVPMISYVSSVIQVFYCTGFPAK